MNKKELYKELKKVFLEFMNNKTYKTIPGESVFRYYGFYQKQYEDKMGHQNGYWVDYKTKTVKEEITEKQYNNFNKHIKDEVTQKFDYVEKEFDFVTKENEVKISEYEKKLKRNKTKNLEKLIELYNYKIKLAEDNLRDLNMELNYDKKFAGCRNQEKILDNIEVYNLIKIELEQKRNEFNEKLI